MSHALATNAPRLGRITRIVIPTVNSMTPTTPMNAVAETGRNCCAIGATDASQFASRLKNLSSPASVAIRPIAMRSAVTVPLSRVSMCRLQGNRVAGPQEVTSVLRLQGMHQERCMESRVGHMPSAAVRPDTLYAWSGPSLLVVNTRGECAEDQRLTGYYFRETRFLRTLQLRINGHTPWPCEAASIAPDTLAFTYVHPEITNPTGCGTGQAGAEENTDSDGVPARALDIRVLYSVRAGWLDVGVSIANPARQPLHL